MSGRKSKQLRKQLIEKLGRAPSPSEWRRYKRHGIAVADKEVPRLSPERSAEIKEKVMEAVRTHQPLRARRTWWQRFMDWLLRRDKRSRTDPPLGETGSPRSNSPESERIPATSPALPPVVDQKNEQTNGRQNP